MSGTDIVHEPEVLDADTAEGVLTRARYSPELFKALRAAEDFAKKSVADSTRRAYHRAWADFEQWCSEMGVPALPAVPEVVGAYLAHLAQTKKVATISKILAAISQAHTTAGFESPRHSAFVRKAMTGIRKTIGGPQKQMDAVSPEQLRAMLATLPDDLKGCRDRVLLLFGFNTSFRRSEIVALRFEDIKLDARGMRVYLRKSKTDQQARGRTVGVPYGSTAETCAVRMLRRWQDASGVKDGHIFRFINNQGRFHASHVSDAYVWRLMRRVAKLAGIDGLWGGHSLRAGHVTSAYRAGKREIAIQKQTGHKSLDMLARYIRDINLFDDNSATDIGL